MTAQPVVTTENHPAVAVEALQREVDHLRASNRELADFAAVVAHDLLEPLATVTGYLKLLERRFGDGLNPEALELVLAAVNGATTMSGLVGEVLDYARVDATPPVRDFVDLAEVVGAARRAVAATEHDTDATIAIDQLPTVTGDGHLLVRLFQHLLSNALKFRRPDTRPAVAIAVDHTDPEDNAGVVTLSVADNGIGIPPADRERVFGMFARLHARRLYPGTGIGLAQCRKIIQHHRGRIWIEDSPLGGTAVRFTLLRSP